MKRSKHKRRGEEIKEQSHSETALPKKLEIVLKCDTSGFAEAVISALDSLELEGVQIDILSTGVGAVNNSDIFMAETGSRLVVGFNVGVMPHIDRIIAEHTVEIRIYDIIYRLSEDIERIARSLVPREAEEEIFGSARVIALFKSSRRGIILGCEVMRGKLTLGKPFRVVGAMGPLYTGRIESLHIEKEAVKEAMVGQRVGLKIRDFDRVEIGDLIESFREISGQHIRPWQPQGKIFYP